MPQQYTDQEIEKGRWLFSGECEFKIGAQTIEQIPPINIKEVAFAGVSNVGKSSLINALTNRNSLARTSNTPGRTKQLNFFSLREQLMLVDLPGYGYAKVSRKEVAGWNKLIHDYLRGRANLVKLCILIDSRRSLKESDIKLMDFLDDIGLSYQIILTKCDKCKKNDLENIIDKIQGSAYKHTAMHPEVLITSSGTKEGIDILRANLAKL